jgi:hypothetical protein
MRKVLTGVAVLLVLSALFAGSWFVTGLFDDGDETTTPTTLVATENTATMDGSENGGTSSPTTVAGVLSLTRPTDLISLNNLITDVTARLGGGEVYKTRLRIYAVTTYFDTTRRAGLSTIISPAAGAQDGEQALLASSNALVEIVGNQEAIDIVATWGTLTPESRTVVDAVVAAAKADGFDAAAAVTAPSYDGELGWKPGSTRNGTPGGVEPGFGNVKTLRLPEGRCAVAPAPFDAIAGERRALGTLDLDAASPSIVDPGLSFVVTTYLFDQLSDRGLPEVGYIAQMVHVMLYDAFVVTWEGKWANGVASPIDVVVAGDLEKITSFPSYPSWQSVSAKAVETYVSKVLGRDVTLAEILDRVEAISEGSNGDELVKTVRADQASLGNGVFNWKADIAAGEAVGSCIGDVFATSVK